MATRNIVPRADREGQIGTSAKNWLQNHTDTIYCNKIEFYPISGFLLLPNMNTSGRDSLTASTGMLIYNTQNSRVEKFDGTWGALGGGGATTFSELTDTPSSLSGGANKYIKVNAGETALVYDTPAGTGDVVGPSSANSLGIALFSGTGGKALWAGIPTVSSSGSINIPSGQSYQIGGSDFAWDNLDKTSSDLADIATRSHTDLTDKGSNTHTQIDNNLTSNTAGVTSARIHINDQTIHFTSSAIQDATTSLKGIVELATDAETSAQSLTTVVVTPSNLAQFVKTIPPGGKNKVTNMYYNPTTGQVEYEVEA